MRTRIAPTALARRSESGRSLLVRCPYCRKQHIHGAPRPEFGASDGHRSAHCLTPSAEAVEVGYVVVEVPFAMH